LCRDNSVHYVDMRLGDVVRLEGVVSLRQLTRCAFSPCGSLLFVACESGAVVCFGTVKRERLGQLDAAQLGHSAPCRSISYHPTYHALCAISYQPGAIAQIWRHDLTLAASQLRNRVQVRPGGAERTKPIGASIGSSERSSSLPPLPSPILSSNNLNRIKTQFDTALDRMKLLNESKTSLDNRLERTASRNLFPSANTAPNQSDLSQSMMTNESDVSLNQSKPRINSSVRFNVEKQMKRLKQYDSQIRQLSPAKRPEPEPIRIQLENHEAEKEENAPAELQLEAEAEQVEKVVIIDKVEVVTTSAVVEHADEIQTRPKKKKRRKKRAELPPLPPQQTPKLESTDERLPDTSAASNNVSVLDQLRSIASST